MTMFAFIGPVFYKVVYMSLTALVAGAAVLLLRRLADRRFSPFWKYAMWVLVLAALVVPWRPQSRAAVLAPAEAVEEISFREAYSQAQMAYSATLAQAQATSPEIEAARKEATLLRAQTLAFDELLPLLWLCGTGGAATFMGIGALRLRRCIWRSQITGDTRRYEELLNRCKQKLGVKRRVRIVLQSHVGTPALLGLLRPAVLLPSYAASMSDERLEYVILHELSHLRRGDGLVNALLLALRAVYWFNPLVWLLLRYVREDMELANDAAVLRGMGSEAQREYSLSLVEVLMGCGKQRHAMLCMADGKKNIERRIGMIQLGGFFRKRKWVIAAAGVLVIGAIAALFLTKGISRGERYGFPEAGVTVTVQLPKGMEIPDFYGAVGDQYSLVQKAVHKGGRGVGLLMVDPLDIPEEHRAIFLEDPQKNYRALFQQLPMGSIVYADEYQQVWTSDGGIEGSATVLIYEKDEFEPGAAALAGYHPTTRVVLAYNLTLNRYVQMDLDYGALTDEEHAAIAKSLRIAGSGAQPVEFGQSDDPAVIALGKAVDNGLLTPLRIPDGWRLLAPDESISLDLMYYGDIWQLNAAMRMQPFYASGLNETWWNSGGFAFDKMRAMASSFARPYSTDGLCLLSSDWWSKAGADFPPAALFSSLTDQINLDNAAFTPVGDWYKIGLDVYSDNRSGNPRMRFAEDGSALEFVLDAGFYFKGRLKPAKLQGWEYDAEAGTLTKRFTATKNQAAPAPLSPTFLSVDTGREALKPLIWGSDGWWIDAQGDYIFAHFFRYIVRYDTKTNRIDKLIDLGDAPQYWWYSATYSPDGQSCVAQAREFDGPGQTGKVLIDLKKETVKPTEQEHYPHGMDSKPYQVDYQYDNGWFINKAEIKAMRPYTGANGTAVAIAMDRNRVGAILPSEAGWDALGYYKFAVVDLKQDKIVQECPMNVLKPGEVLSLYPPEPEPEPLLIDYHLQSVTVLRPRFPMDGRSSYDGFDVVKVVDAPADVASFEECLKSGAWTLTDAGGWIKGDPSSPQDHGILYMRGEDGRGLIAHLFSDPKKENPQGGAVALAMCDPMPAPPEKYRDSIGSDAFSRYWVAWDVYKILYGLAVSD